jgi:hypothetical protein
MGKEINNKISIWLERMQLNPFLPCALGWEAEVFLLKEESS